MAYRQITKGPLVALVRPDGSILRAGGFVALTDGRAPWTPLRVAVCERQVRAMMVADKEGSR